MRDKITGVYLSSATNSTLFTNCCQVAVCEVGFGGGVEPCPVCGAKVEGQYRWVWQEAFRRSMTPEQYAKHRARVDQLIREDRERWAAER